MIIVLLGSIFIFILFYIVGISINQLVFNEIPTGEQWMETFFLGMLGLNAIASIVSIFFSAGVTFYISILIAILCCINNKFLWIRFREVFLKAISTLHIPSLSIILFVMISGIKYPYHPDSWLYHIQSIKWLEEYPFIPGLGNLHERFAFNPNFFTLSAAFTFRNIFGQPLYFINLVTFCVILLYLSTELNKSKPDTEKVFKFGFLSLGLIIYCGQNISSPSHDLSSLFYFVPVALIILRKFSHRYDYEIVTLFSLAAIINKVIFLPLALFIVVIFILNFKKLKVSGSTKVHFKVFIFALSIMIPWLYSNYILSGYLLFPYYKVDLFNPDWKIPLEVVKNYQFLIKDFASRNGITVTSEFYTLSYYKWLSFWLSTLSKTSKLYSLYIFSSLGLIFLLSLFRLFRFKIQVDAFILSLTGILFVMAFGPDIRYLFPYLLLLVLSFKMMNLTEHVKFQYYKVINYLVVSTFILHLTYSLYKQQYHVSTRTFIFPNTNKNIIESLPSGASSYSIGNNITVTVPISTFCFDEPLPCTIEEKKINLRNTTITSGFKAVK